ncbi:alpha/beta fold hydrolase [Halococcus sp. IIIV-5B]|uniref:alpha/beta fold hydrolase n=1 Tax=Halococcus sp. IIIV-5B TaxID=2321230 RepID=UPI001F17A081|nr:alpha/beta hydrolase [Halococcus sp. IIIV-5B]
MRSRTVRGGDGVELYVEETGPADGPTVLFLHGYSQSRLSWTKQFESSLADEFRLVRVDNRGHGRSETPREKRAYTDSSLWAADVQAVVETLDEVVIVAWSYGCLVALDYLRAYGTDDVRGVNFVGIVSGMGTDAATELLGSAYLELFPAITSEDAEESVRTLERFVERSVAGDLDPVERYFVLGYNAVVPPFVRDGMRSRTLSHRETVAELDVPLLFTHGEEDRIVDPRAVEVTAALASDARTSLYPNVGHTPFREAPDRFDEELRAFVRRT